MKKRIELPSKNELLKLFSYKDGKLYWNVNRGSRAITGRISGTKGKYFLIGINGKSYRRSRIVYKMFYNKEPDYIDHINGNTFDDRISNLQAISNQGNILKARLFSHNTSGFTGVSFMKHRNKYRARIKINGKDIHLGCFENISDAIEARQKAANGIFNYKGL